MVIPRVPHKTLLLIELGSSFGELARIVLTGDLHVRHVCGLICGLRVRQMLRVLRRFLHAVRLCLVQELR